MSERVQHAAELASRVDAGWDATRTEASLDRLHGKLRRRRLTRGALGTAAALLLGVLLWPRPQPVAVPAPIAAEPRRLMLRDGSSATPRDGATLELLEDSASRTTVALESGAAHFEVTHSSERVFTVTAGKVSVIDLGTVFDVEREASRVRVSVESGRVRVEAPQVQAQLTAGEARWFAFDPPLPTLEAPVPAVAPSQPLPVAPARPLERAKAPPRWKGLANEGRFDEAFRELSADPKGAGDHVEDLMLAADAARLSHHPREAIELLGRVVSAHQKEPQAPLAAFTLGKLLLDAGRFAEAADAFSAARTLAPGGALEEDALAREVEARARAGDAERAKALAQQYLRSFPGGARAETVRKLSGLSP